MKAKVLSILLACTVLSGMSVLSDDVIKTDAANKKINFVVYFGTSQLSQYGVPSSFIARYNVVTANVSNKFLNDFGITVQFTKPVSNYVVQGPSDLCKQDVQYFNALCHHAGASACSNAGPYHHSNAVLMCNSVFPRPRPYVNGLELYIDCTKMCYVNPDNSHQAILGMAFLNTNTILVRDNDYTKYVDVQNWLGDTQHTQYVTMTMVHEIGHLYGVSDHYDVALGDDRDYCI